jgi:excinuclease ABC subunit C
MELKDILENIPVKPGVYMMKDNRGSILYIGKAKNLRSRVRSYFQDSASLTPRIKAMLSVVADMDYVITENEVEALILESNLVKKHKPKFNIILRDDKHFPYLRLAADEMFPYLSIARRVKKDKGIYFGPYTSAKSLRRTLKLIHKIFQLRQSRDPLDGAPKRRPCLNYQMGRCLAPCAGYVKKEDYERAVKDVALFLKGRNDELLNNLNKKMNESSENLRFEDAARIRDQISAIEMTMEKQNIISTSLEDHDVIAVYRDNGRVNIQLLFIRGGKIIGDKNLIFTYIEGIDDAEILSSFVRQYYSGDVFIPDEIILETEIDERNIVKDWLSEKKGRKVDIIAPERGRKRELVLMAKENAAISLRMTLNSAALRRELLEDLKARLGLRRLPLRIEAFDMSTIMGTSAVGSMVVFNDGEPAKNEYKRFRIKTLTGMDDYGMMREVLMRRYSKLVGSRESGVGSQNAKTENSQLTTHNSRLSDIPDLIIVDGGKGQLNTLITALKELSITDIDTIGIAKGEDRNNPETDMIYLSRESRVESRESEKTLPLAPCPLPLDSSGRHLIQRIRDEAHRFAIAYHRKLRDKEGISSELDEIPGIGPKRKKTLLKHFGSLKKIREATIKELIDTLHISEKTAMELHERLL